MKILSEEEAKVFENNEQVKFMVSRFQDVMNKVSGFDAKLQGALQSVSNFIQDLETLSKNHKKLDEFAKESNQVIGAALHSDKINFQKNDLQLNWMATAIKSLEDDIKQFTIKIAGISSQITQLDKRFVDFSSLEYVNNLKKDLINLETQLKNRDQDTQEKILDAHSKLADARFNINSHSADIANLGKSFKEQSAKLNNLAGDISLSKSYVDNKHNILETFFLNHVKTAIEAIPKPIIPSLDDAKKSMEDKIQPALIDAKNANLRSDNNEKKIYLLEKKVEQLQLLLNKYQLQG